MEKINQTIYDHVKEDVFISFLMLSFIVLAMLILFRKVSKHISDVEKHAEDISFKDKLTDTYNRHFLEDFNQHYEHFNDEKQKFVVAFLDIDHFKKINDTYGHDGGDEVLKAFAHKLLLMTRSKDFVIRYGGEEFLVLIYNISLEEAMKKFEDIRKSIESMSIELKGDIVHITVSIGVHIGNYNEKIHDVISKADEAVYEAKNTGRNKICLSSSRSIKK